MVSKGPSKEEKKVIKRILKYVHRLKDEQLIQPMSRSALIEELQIDNPIAIDVVQVWLHVRRLHILFNQESIAKLELLKQEYLQLLLDREKAAADLLSHSEDDWEDLDEEQVEEEEKKDMVMSGKRISMRDLANVLEFSLRTQLMMTRKCLGFGGN